MNIVLMGMKYTGKSTVGSGLAELIGAGFRDTDDVMLDIYAEKAGKRQPLREILPQRGEAYFGELEAQASERILNEVNASDQGFVVSLGGRCPLNAAAMEYITQIGPVVYLKNSPEVLLERLAKAPRPSFLKDKDPAAQFLDIYNVRKGVYEKLADLTIDMDGLDIPAAIKHVRQAISSL